MKNTEIMLMNTMSNLADASADYVQCVLIEKAIRNSPLASRASMKRMDEAKDAARDALIRLSATIQRAGQLASRLGHGLPAEPTEPCDDPEPADLLGRLDTPDADDPAVINRLMAGTGRKARR